MRRLILDTGITLSNRAWKLAGRQPVKPVGFRVVLPDPALTSLCRTTFEELNNRIASPFGHRLRTKWMQSSHDPSSASSTETAFASMLLRHWDPETALEILKLFFLNRSLEGKMPLAINPAGVSTFPAYPFVLLALCKYHEITGDTTRTRELFRKYLKYADWLVIYHKGEGGFYLHRDETWFRHDFLVAPLLAAEPSAGADWRGVLSVGLNSIIAYQYRLLSRAAFASGEQRDGRKLDNHARKLAVMLNEKFWNEEKKFYLDIVGDAPAQSLTPAGLLPVLAEAPIRSQLLSMLPKSAEFASALSLELGAVRKNSVFLYLIADGLIKYGMHREALAVAAEFAGVASRLTVVPETLCQRIVAVNAIIDQIIGYFNFGDRLVLFPHLPEAWIGASGIIEDTARGLKVEFSYKENSQVDYVITTRAGKTITLAIENFKFKNIDLTGAGPAAPPVPAPDKKI